MSLVLFCIAIYLMGGIGASMGYHRVLTHRSAEMPKWFKYSLVLLGLPAGTPVQWAGNHRAHHQFTDQNGDPHSPILEGFWYAHCGWYLGTKNPIICFIYSMAGPLRMFIDGILRPRTNQQHNHFAKDISSDRFFVFISRPLVYMILLWVYASALVFISWFFWQWTGVFWLWMMLVLIYNLGDSVDSFGHLFGDKHSENHSRNNIILGWLCFGDGWHANHHEKPLSAKHGRGKFQFDLTFIFLRIFNKIGLVKKIRS
jgi:fatty-acid desaturase